MIRSVVYTVHVAVTITCWTVQCALHVVVSVQAVC